MTRLTALRSPATDKQTVILLLILLIVVAGFSWNYDALLFVRLRVVANDAFSVPNVEVPLLMLDGSDELRAFPPTRIAGFTACPSSQIRAVACLSLAERTEDRDPRPWIGVAPRLLQSFMTETDEIVRDCARTALLNIPLIPIEDVPSVVAFIESTEANDDVLRPLRVSLVGKVLVSDPERLPWVASVYKLWIESPEVKDRRAGFEQLMALAPNSGETLAAFQTMMKAGDPDRIAETAGRRLLRWHSFLIDECLKGNDAERRFILQCAVEETRMKANRYPNSLGDVFTEAQLKRVQQVEESSLVANATTIDDVNKACEFIRYRPRGEEVLIAVAGRLNGAKRETALRHVALRKEERRRL